MSRVLAIICFVAELLISLAIITIIRIFPTFLNCSRENRLSLPRACLHYKPVDITVCQVTRLIYGRLDGISLSLILRSLVVVMITVMCLGALPMKRLGTW